jgi:hypothetical protein
MNRTPSTLIPLENVRVASPCRADWSRMEGDDRVRFCRSCAKNVYNLSALSKAEAEKLIAEKEGKLCVRFYQRADGTVLTDNCPVGLKTVRRPFQYLLAGFAALLASGAALMAKEASTPSPPGPPTNFRIRSIAFVNAIISRFDGSSTSGSYTMGAPVMGVVICPQPTPTPKPKK